MNAELITPIAQYSPAEPSAQRNESARVASYPPGYCCMTGKKNHLQDSANPTQKQLGSSTPVCPMTCVRVKFQDLNWV
jgi:hypothetical protein